MVSKKSRSLCREPFCLDKIDRVWLKFQAKFRSVDGKKERTMWARKFFVTVQLVAILIMALAAVGLAEETATDAIGDPLPTGALVRLGTSRFHAPSSVYELAISPDEKTVVTIGNYLIAWDAASGQERWRVGGRGDLQTSYGVHGAAFTADGRLY